jgi:hypothetical protein
MDEECAICKDPMGLKTFDDSAEEGLENTCYRLSCKHAFHATCIIGSLRASGSTCPICRDGEAPPPQTFGWVVDDASSETTNPENERLLDLQNVNPQVRAAASNLNRSVKAFNIFRDRLRSHRRKALALAMRDFRAKYDRPFRMEKERVRQTLNTYRSAVHASDSSIELVDIAGLLQQDNTHASVRRQDPMRTSFWYY